ncbi:MAG: hypothetical protein AAF614_37420 [Chloroflexota bacterium]
MLRFTCSNPPHMHYPAVIDWHVHEYGERISISSLVRRANELQRELNALKQTAEKDYQETVADFLAGTGRV